MLMLSCKNDTIVIVEKGKSNYEIVYIDDATKSQYESAKILKNYIYKISKVNLPIVDESSQSAPNKIYIGNITGEDLGLHQIILKTENNNLFISGGSDKAVRNAVYEFLERYLNCKWYAPGVEKIPLNPAIVLRPIKYSYTPEITTRTVHSRLFYKNTDFADKLKVTHEAFPHYIKDARVHTFHKFVPEEKLYRSNPEFYALRNGVRLPTQLCLTNEKVYEIVKDSVASLFVKHPESTVVSVSQNDNQQYCECDNCKKVDTEEDSHSGTMIRFVNRIANAFPDKTISTLAYQYTRKACKTKPKPNVLITLCSIECDRSAPIEEKCVDFATDLRAWHELTENIRIWDYTTQFTNFLAPFPNIKTLAPNIRFFKDNNAKWIFEQHSNNPSELFELRSYVMAKLLWNPDLKMEDLIAEFTEGYYEEAGVFVKQYINLIHQKIKEDKSFFLFLYGGPSEAFDSYLNPDLLSDYSRFFDDAEKAVLNKPEILQRVRVARMGVDFAVLEACRKNMNEKFSLVKKDAGFKVVVNPLVTTLLGNFKNNCIKEDISLMNEMGFTTIEYYDNYKKAIAVALKPNKAIGKKVTLFTKPKKYANEDPQVLTDGALGGSGFYANWLGFEGNDMEAMIDMGSEQEISSISMAFLQVTNHIVFFPLKVSYSFSMDNKNYVKIGTVENTRPLLRTSKVNDIQYFDLKIKSEKVRYIKIKVENVKEAPYWHHAAGLPSWIFADEIIIN